MTLPHIPETPEVFTKYRGIDEALEAIAKGDDRALEHLFQTNAEVHALIWVGRKWALRDYPLRAAANEWKTTDAFRNDRFLHIPETPLTKEWLKTIAEKFDYEDYNSQWWTEMFLDRFIDAIVQALQHITEPEQTDREPESKA